MPQTVQELHTALEALYCQNDRTQLEHFFMEQILEYIPGCCALSEEYVFLMNEAGSYYRGTSQFAKAISTFLTLARAMERFELDRTAGYATVLNNLAGSYRMAGDCAQAEKCFQQALALYEALKLEESFGYASALNNLSLCYQAAGEYEKALTYQVRAIEAVQAGRLDDEALAASYSNLANIYYTLGRREDAFAAIERSLELFEEAGCLERSSYWGALHTHAFLQSAAGDMQLAEQEYRKVMALLEEHLGRNADYVAAAKGAATACRAQGKQVQALELIGQAAQAARTIFGSDSPRCTALLDLQTAWQNESGGL